MRPYSCRDFADGNVKRPAQTAHKPTIESPIESPWFLETLKIQCLDACPISVTFTMLVPEMLIVSGSFIDWIKTTYTGFAQTYDLVAKMVGN